ncbi:MAG: ABC transporter permease [Lewinellaceae bacterium]|nr:ABC transporter permease [Phaeodactylibacter sp.]MCB9037181.1 ABC transporter permease [Lewinellaceae bacterium]
MNSPERSDISVLRTRLHPPRKGSLLYHWRTILKNIRAYSFFIRQLVRINILKDFKRSYIGLLWLFILPVISVIIWILLNGAGIIEPGDTGIPYPAFVLLSTAIWGFFAEIYQSTSKIFTDRGNMMIMARFPHEVLVVERLLVHLIRFVIPFLINIVVLLLFGVRFTWLALLFPLTLLPLLILGVAIGLIVSLLRVVAVDIASLVDRGIGFLMFLTPVVYAPRIKVGWLSEAIRFNPLTYLVGFSRDVLTQGTFYEPATWGICILLTLIFFLFAARVFAAAEPKVMERLINN